MGYWLSGEKWGSLRLKWSNFKTPWSKDPVLSMVIQPERGSIVSPSTETGWSMVLVKWKFPLWLMKCQRRTQKLARQASTYKLSCKSLNAEQKGLINVQLNILLIQAGILGTKTLKRGWIIKTRHQPISVRFWLWCGELASSTSHWQVTSHCTGLCSYSKIQSRREIGCNGLCCGQWIIRHSWCLKALTSFISTLSFIKESNKCKLMRGALFWPCLSVSGHFVNVQFWLRM